MNFPGAQAMQQLSGINVLVFYAPHTLTTDVGMDYEPSLQVGAGLTVTFGYFPLSVSTTSTRSDVDDPSSGVP